MQHDEAGQDDAKCDDQSVPDKPFTEKQAHQHEEAADEKPHRFDRDLLGHPVEERARARGVIENLDDTGRVELPGAGLLVWASEAGTEVRSSRTHKNTSGAKMSTCGPLSTFRKSCFGA